MPLFALVTGGDWTGSGLSRGDMGAVITSVLGGAVAIVLIAGLGTPVAVYLARRDGRISVFVEAMVLIPLLMPALAIGILLVAFYGPNAPAGAAFARLGLVLTNTRAAFVLAALYAALPTYIIAARAAFREVPPSLEAVALSLGDAPIRVFFRVTLPLARNGLAAALALAWARALGEFGIVLMIAYFPSGLPVRLWIDVQEFGVTSVFPLLAAFLAVALPVPLWLGLRGRRRAV